MRFTTDCRASVRETAGDTESLVCFVAMTDDEAGRDPRIYLAAERTFLAWIRTALALLAFGFVVARFAALARVGSVPVADDDTRWLWVGVTLIVAGIATGVVASIRHDRYVRAIDQGNFRSVFRSRLAHAVVGLLTVVGIWSLVLLMRS